MVLAAADRTFIKQPPPRYTKTGYWEADVLASNLKGFWRFNKFSGESNADAAKRCSRNLKPGAANLALDRLYPGAGGLPTFSTDSARFRNDTPLVTREVIKGVSDGGTGEGCIFALAKSDDPNTGATAADRSLIAGTFGNTLNKGLALLFNNNQDPYQAQGLSYEVTDSALHTTAVAVTTGTHDLWRLWYLEWTPTTLRVANLTGDSTNPSAITLAGGHLYGSQTFSIGGRITSGVNYTASNVKDIAAVALFDAVPSEGNRNTLAAQMLRVFDETALDYFDA